MNFLLVLQKSVLICGEQGTRFKAIPESSFLFRMSLDNKKVHKKIVLLLLARKEVRIFTLPFTQPLFRMNINNVFMLYKRKRSSIFVLDKTSSRRGEGVPYIYKRQLFIPGVSLLFRIILYNIYF